MTTGSAVERAMIMVPNFLSLVLRMTALPVLRAIGGVIWTLMVPTLRLLSAVCFVVAAVALASDVGPIGAEAQHHFQPTAAMTHWHTIAPGSLEATQGFIVKRMRPWIWDAVSAPLKLPSFVFFSGLGVLLGYFGRRRREVAIFAN